MILFFLQNNLFFFNFLNISLLNCFLQLIILYLIFQTLFFNTSLKLSFIYVYIVIYYSLLLYFHKLDVFATFLLVVELSAFVFILSLLLYFNNSNWLKKGTNNYIIQLLCCFTPFVFLKCSSVYYTNYISLGCNSYNDLLVQFIYFSKNPYLLALIGVLLLILSIVLVNIFIIFNLNIFQNNFEYYKSTNSMFKYQNMWSQFTTNPLLKFFN